MANVVKVISGVKKVIKKNNSKSITAAERGFAKNKTARKEMKQQDVVYSKAFKKDLKSGKVGAAYSTVSKSQSKALTPKVPVKKKGK